MRISISVTNFSWRGGDLDEHLSRIAQAADGGGLYGVWVADHLLQADPYGARPGETEMLEAYTTLGLPRGSDGACAVGHAGDRRDLPPARPAREGRDHVGRAVAGSGDVRGRRRLRG